MHDIRLSAPLVIMQTSVTPQRLDQDQGADVLKLVSLSGGYG